jgi:hypothetical protein
VNEHPYELLPEYADGALSDEERAGVEAHLATCDVCREELELAGEARAVLGALPEVDPPFGATRPVLRRARAPRWWSSPAAWRVAAVAAAAVVVVAGTTIVLTNRAEEEPAGVSAPPPAGQRDDRGVAGGEDAADGESALESAATRALDYPRFERTRVRYTAANLGRAARGFVAEARSALQAGFPSNGVDFYSSFDLRTLPVPAQRAISCVNQGQPPDRTIVPFVIEEARFEDEAAYLVVFLAGYGPDATYDRVQVLVVAREGCALRHFARATL